MIAGQPATVTFPGLFDLQVNGFGGVDFNDAACTADGIARAITAMRATGVTRFLPTYISSSFDAFARAVPVAAECTDPAVAGIHMEGPYLANGARGAHPAEALCDASIEDFKRRQDAASGRIVLVTLAPEVPGALALTEYLVARGVRVALGHTVATPEQIRDGISAGATMSTHLGNGTPPLLPRHPNFIWEQLASDQLHACLIVDGHHLQASVVKVMVRAKSPAKTILVTDAISAAAQPPGRYTIGAVDAELSATGRVTPVGGGASLAGSALTLDAAVARTVAYAGVSLQDALAMASTQPARYLGLEPAGHVTATWDEGRHQLKVERVTT